MSDRVMVFIDYENVRRSARDQFAPLDASSEVGHVDPSRVADLLAARRRFASDVLAVHVYRGHPLSRRQPASAAAHSRQLATWSRDRRVSVHLRPLNYLGWPAYAPR
jgi:hypothetical protein